MISHPTDGGAAAGHESLKLIRRAYARLQDYYRWADRKFGGAQNEMGLEAYTRLNQTIRLLEMIVACLDETAALPQPPANGTIEAHQAWTKSPEGDASLRGRFKHVEDMQIFTECAYPLAWRSSRAIRKLSDLSRFDPVGVRNVRNKLIEHVDGKDSGVLINSFGWGGEQGPVVRAMRTEDKKDLWPDAGLFVNMAEFSDDLIRRIDTVLAGEVVPPPSP